MCEIVFGYTPFAGYTALETLTNVMNYETRAPLVFKRENALYSDMYSECCNSLIGAMLRPDPNARPSLDAIFVDEFFARFDWQALSSQRMEPPAKPNSKQKSPSRLQEFLDNTYDAELDASEVDVTGFARRF
jgi:serine/threonine protein kinase